MTVRGKIPDLQTSTIQFSIIIPTLNRCEMLGVALRAVCAQDYPLDRYEIIVVDNGSSDATKVVVASFSSRVKYVYESRPGLHWARHAGARAAVGSILAYTDDDAEPVPHWLSSIALGYSQPEIAAVGGPIHVRWITPPPEWANRQKWFGYLDYGTEPLIIEYPKTLNGGNFTILKEVLFDVGGFNPDTAVEDRLVGDGEAGLCRKLSAAGYKMAYVPNALVFHLQNGGTMTLARMSHRIAQQARFQVYATYKASKPSSGQLLVSAAHMFYCALVYQVKALKHIRKRDSGYYHRQIEVSGALAAMSYQWRLVVDPHFRDIVLRENWIEDS